MVCIRLAKSYRYEGTGCHFSSDSKECFICYGLGLRVQLSEAKNKWPGSSVASARRGESRVTPAHPARAGQVTRQNGTGNVESSLPEFCYPPIVSIDKSSGQNHNSTAGTKPDNA